MASRSPYTGSRYSALLNWEFNQYLLGLINENPRLSGDAIQAFNTAQRNTDLEELLSIKGQRSLSSNPRQAELRAIRMAMEEQFNEMRGLKIEYRNAESELDEASIMQQYRTLIQEANQLTINYQDIIRTFEKQVGRRLNRLRFSNSLVRPSNIFAANEQIVNNIQLFHLSNLQKSLSDNQASALYSVANQCPYRENSGAPTGTMKLYPNPATEELNIALDGYDMQQQIAIELYDFTGKVVMVQFLNRLNTNLSLDRLDEGIYFCSLLIDGIKQETQRVILQDKDMKLIYLGLALLPSLLLAQKHDYIWNLGYGGGKANSEQDSFGLSILDFNQGDSLNIRVNHEPFNGYDFANTTMSDRSGKMLFSSNGSSIYNFYYGRLLGGENINISENHGYILPQGVLALPHPRDSNLYAFFHGRKGYGPRVTETWYSEIDMSLRLGLGELSYIQPLIQDTLPFGQFTAVKHGNGRDWWVLFQHYCLKKDGCISNFFYRVLLNPEGVKVFQQQIIRSPVTETGAGQAVFTPDGTKYVVSQADQFDKPVTLDVYDFDRCRGRFGKKQQVKSIRIFRGENGGSGLVVSPNSRFAYLITWTTILQYDLWASDIKASETIVAEYDGFIQYGRSGFPLATRFLFGQLAPDGKIYISTTNATQYLHVIHNPNEKGLACNIEQHGIYLPTSNGFSIPNHPNYRLGAWEGSPCDTLRDTSVATTDLGEKANIKIYPNPSTGLLNIAMEDVSKPYQKMQVRVYDLLGKALRQYEDITVIDLSNYPKGMYWVSVLLDGQVLKTEKIIVQY